MGRLAVGPRRANIEAWKCRARRSGRGSRDDTQGVCNAGAEPWADTEIPETVDHASDFGQKCDKIATEP